MQQGTGSPRSDPAQISASQPSRRAAFTARCAHESTPKATGAASSSEPHKGEAAATNTEGTRTSALTRKRAQAAIHRPQAIAACPDRTAPCIRFTRETHCFRLQTKASYRCPSPPSGPGRQSACLTPLNGKPAGCRNRRTHRTHHIRRAASCRTEGTAPRPHALPRGSLTPWRPWANAA